MLIDGLVEREIRTAMKTRNLSSIPIYPESRACKFPTADKIYDVFRDVRLHRVTSPSAPLQTVPDTLSEIQVLVLDLLDLKPPNYFQN